MLSSLSAACRTIGVTEDDLTNWTRRGYLSLGSFGRGRERQIENAEIFRAAIIKRCQRFGISPSRSSSWATISLELMRKAAVEGRVITQIVIRQYKDNSESICSSDDLAPPGALVALIIDVGNLKIEGATC